MSIKYVFVSNGTKETKEKYEEKKDIKISSFSRTSLIAAKELGYDVYCGVNKKYAKDIQNDLNVKLYNQQVYRNPFNILEIVKAYKSLSKLVRKEKIDIIHCNTPIGGVIGRLVGKKYNVRKVIYEAHGFHFYKGAPIKNWLLYYPIEKWLSKYTDIIITINKEDYGIAKTFYAKRVEYIPGVGLDLKKFNIKVDKKEKRKELGIKEDDFLILSVGELNKNKNHEIVLKAIAKLDNPDIKYIICGVGPLKEYLENLIKELNLSDQVQLLGYRNDIIELNKISNLFVFPSKREGLSISIMEAMASGLPVVASDIRGNRDLIDNNKGGSLFEYDNEKDIVEKINFLVNKQELILKMGIHNLNKIMNYKSEKIIEEIKNLYKN